MCDDEKSGNSNEVLAISSTVSAIVGLMAGVMLSMYIDGKVITNQLSSCMEKLPRDQYCTMIAVPSTIHYIKESKKGKI